MTKYERELLERIEAKLDCMARWHGGPLQVDFLNLGYGVQTPERVVDAMESYRRQSTGYR